MNLTLRGPALVDDTVLPDVLVHVDGERITAVTPLTAGAEPPPGADAAERVSGTMLPAYVDIHCHGGGGTAFTDLRDDAAAAAAEHHHAHGSTSLLASLVTMSSRDLERGVAMLAELADDGVVDGIHLEGPWLAEARCGAHDPTLLRDPSLAEVERLIELGRGHIRQVTLAPERAHGLDLVRWLTSAGIHAAVGHTTATYAQVEAAVAAGADLATHLFNGMDPWHHRTPGAVAALMRSAARGHVTVELIADGAHLSDDTVRTVLDLVGADHVAFVSDAMAAAGVGDGAYVLGGLSVVVDRGIARLTRDPDGTTPGSIAGGTSHVADIVARAVAAGVPMAYAVRPATRTPARALGLADRGALAVGSRADVVVVDEAARATRVMRRGRWLESPLP
ncbi:N-acetylglucosamine-6-phosphate deacetylase [Terrabacter sp. Root181]|uniref:N-acetylglucosamine-6-phosphate deacetylase n=1 Tax=Terrabacter sp. Root181 TaxID=1736484 RepID=UPI0006F67AAB|nr:amidohydrolase family protein [Terrabacter sp. Root181]KRB47692.1 N-acetylglucosamine-6-phosphate deacetylase [Terrabacter sp. Root181]